MQVYEREESLERGRCQGQVCEGVGEAAVEDYGGYVHELGLRLRGLLSRVATT